MLHLIVSSIGLVISFLALAFVIHARPSRIQSGIFTTLVLIFFYFVCNIWQETSASVIGWLMSMRFTYIAYALIFYIMGITLAKLSGSKISNRVFIATTILVCVSVVLFLSVGYTDLFYKDVVMSVNPVNPNYYIFTATKGPLFTVANGAVILLILIMLGSVFVKLPHIKGYGRIFIRLIFIIGLLNPMFYLISFIVEIPSMYTNAIICTLFAILLAHLQVKYDRVMADTVAKDISIDNFTEGLLIFNVNGHLIYHNLQAEKILPECEWGHMDRAVDYLKEHVLGKKVLDIGEENYEIRKTEFKQGRLFEGTIVWIVNTSEQTKLVLQEELNLRTEETLHETVTVLAAAVDAKDRYTNGHSLRVAQYARLIALRMGKSEEYAKNIYLHAMLHDVGKIGIPDEIINKVGKLTDEEYNTIKTHSQMGYDILSEITSHPTLAQAARWHHERYDGKGYPDGLKGEEIPEFARIIAVADAYDAMSSNRSYRNYMTQEKIISEFERCRGTQFDPAIADIWLMVMREDINYILREHPENE